MHIKRQLVLSYLRSSNPLPHTHFSEEHEKLRWYPSFSPRIQVRVGQLQVFPYCFLSLWGFLLSGRWAWQAGGRGIQLYQAMPSDPTPSSAFQPIRPAVGSGSKELPPKGLHLACSSIWPAHRPKLQDIKSQGPGSALTRADELQDGLHVIWGAGAKKILPLGQL